MILIGNIPPGYQTAYKAVCLPLNRLNDEGDLGEEVSHFLHHQVNPGIFKGSSYQKLVITECVGYYGSLVYRDSLGMSYQRIIALDPENANLLSYVAHTAAYNHAESIFEKYGESKLPELARMNDRKAWNFLRTIPFNWPSIY